MTNNLSPAVVKNSLTVLRKNAMHYLDLDPEMKKNPEVILATLKKDGSMLRYMPESVKDDAQMVKEAVSISGLAFFEASERLKLDFDIVMHAATHDIRIMKVAPAHWAHDKKLALALLSFETVRPPSRSPGFNPLAFFAHDIQMLCGSDMSHNIACLQHAIEKEALAQRLNETLVLQAPQACKRKEGHIKI